MVREVRTGGASYACEEDAGMVSAVKMTLGWVLCQRHYSVPFDDMLTLRSVTLTLPLAHSTRLGPVMVAGTRSSMSAR